MAKKEIIAMILAGEKGRRLGVLTGQAGKPALSFGGKYRIIDFPLSNCIHSGINTVGVLTGYKPLRLSNHIGIGIPWDLDRMGGGVSMLPVWDAEEKKGNADGVRQYLDYMDGMDPEYVLILPVDHVYRMDYDLMLQFHKASCAAVTVAATEEGGGTSRYGKVFTDETGRILRSGDGLEPGGLTSMGICIFTYSYLRKALLETASLSSSGFMEDVIPAVVKAGGKAFAYEFEGYWKEITTIGSYWEANMDLTGMVPSFSLYEEHWKIYTKDEYFSPQYLGGEAVVSSSLVGPGSEILGEVTESVLGANVRVGKNAKVEKSVLMNGVRVEEGACLSGCIVAEGSVIGRNARLGEGEWKENRYDPEIYSTFLVTVGEGSTVPEGVRIGKNTVISGKTDASCYPGGSLASGEVCFQEVEA